MTLIGHRSNNHPQQIAVRGADAATDDRAITDADFAPLHERYGFTVDAAASETNAKLPRYWTAEDSAFDHAWDGERVWCNPPYSEIERWVSKAWSEIDAELIVMLLPANRTEQGWWQRLVEPHRIGGHAWAATPNRHLCEPWMVRVEFLPGRMRFVRPNAVIGPKGDRPPFGCCLLIWDRKDLRNPSSDPEPAP